MRWCFGRWLTLAMLLAFWSPHANAQPKIGLRMEPLSIRNRQAAPVPVRVRLEYNQSQYLEGTLELEVYDSLDYISESDLLAKIRREGIVLAGMDYQFNLLLPPLRSSTTRNYAVRAWFVTADQRIPLSSLPDRLNPPEPFDLLMLSDSERGRIIASVCENAGVQENPEEDRGMLQRLLSFEAWGHLAVADSEQVSPNSSAGNPDQRLLYDPLQSLVHHVQPWGARDIPEDPLWLCAFDMLLISERGLAALTPEQLSGVLAWARAGGSLCIHAPERLGQEQLNFLRQLMGFGAGRAGDLTLDSDGKLLTVTDSPDAPILAEPGLGRAVLLPSSVPLPQLLNDVALQGRLLRFLWRFRSDLQMADPTDFRSQAMLTRLAATTGAGSFALDEEGLRVTNPDVVPSLAQRLGDYNRIGLTTSVREDGRQYVEPGTVLSLLRLNGLQPRIEGALSNITRMLLPSTLRLVPTWIMFLILLSYIIVIGPLEYFVLGWLRARKYTWIVFPATTLAVTLLTMAVAQAYMGGQDSLRSLTITDLGEGRLPLRQSTLKTFFYGRQDVISSDHRRQFGVQVSDDTEADPYNSYQPRPAGIPPEYHGSFPENWSMHQPVRQWSPVSVRTFAIAPDAEQLQIPDLPWDNAELVTTVDGRSELTKLLVQLETSTGDKLYGAVFHAGDCISLNRIFVRAEQYYSNPYFYSQSDDPQPGETLLQTVLQIIPTQRPTQASFPGARGYFSLFSGISPQGSGTLEDLVISDSTDTTEWVLLVARISQQSKHQDVEVFRRKYRQ